MSQNSAKKMPKRIIRGDAPQPIQRPSVGRTPEAMRQPGDSKIATLSPSAATVQTPEMTVVTSENSTVQTLAPLPVAARAQSFSENHLTVVPQETTTTEVTMPKNAVAESTSKTPKSTTMTPIENRDPYAKRGVFARMGLTAMLALCTLVIIGLLMLGQKFQPASQLAKATSGEQALTVVLDNAQKENWRAMLQHVNVPQLSDSLASQLADAPDSAYASQTDLKKQLNVDMARIASGVVRELPMTSPVKQFIVQLTGDNEVAFGRLQNIQNEGDVVRGDVTLERPDLLLTSRLEVVAEANDDGAWQLVSLPNVVDVLREVEAVKQAKMKPAPLGEVTLAGSTISTTLKAPKAGAVINHVPFMQDIRTKALPAKGGKLPLELVVTFNNTNAQARELPWRVTFKDKAGQVLGAYALDAQAIATGAGQKHTWNIALPNTGKARHIHALPLSAMSISLVPLG